METFEPRGSAARKALALLLFFALLLLGVAHAVRVLSFSDDVHSKAVYRQFYALPKNCLDVVWIGPSSVQEEVNPAVMYAETGIAVYSFGVPQAPFDAMEYLIRECEKTQNPSLYLVDIRSLAYNTLSDAMVRRATDNMRLSVNRINAIRQLMDDLENSPTAGGKIDPRFTHYVSFVKYHGRWTDLTREDFADDPACYLGFRIDTKIKAQDREAVQARFDAAELPLPEENRVFLLRFLDFCDSLSTPVVFTCTLNCLDESFFGCYNTAIRLIRERGYEVWDLNLEADAMGLDYATDFKDDIHTNVYGAEKLSAHAARVLSARLACPDHRGDARYAIFEKTLERYREALEKPPEE